MSNTTLGADGNAGKREDHHQDGGRHQPVFADARHDASDDDALHRCQDDTHPREEVSDRRGAKLEARLDEEREHRFKRRKGRHHEEGHRQHQGQLRSRPRAPEGRDPARPRRGPRFSGGSDSGRKNSAALKFANERVAAKKAGAE